MPEITASILDYFDQRLKEIDTLSSPHLARWTRLDILYLQWLLSARTAPSGEFGGNRVLSHIAALHEAYKAAEAFVLCFILWENALTWPERYTWGLEVDLLWDRLIAAVECVRAIEES